MTILFFLLGIIIGLLLLLILYRSLQGYFIYTRAVKAFGKQKVVYLNYAYKRFAWAFDLHPKNGMDSLPRLNNEIKKNPDIKIIVISVIESAIYIVCDPEMIRKILNEFSQNVGKSKVLIFYDGV